MNKVAVKTTIRPNAHQSAMKRQDRPALTPAPVILRPLAVQVPLDSRPPVKTSFQPEPLTALPTRIDVAALAQLYNSQPASHIVRGDLLDQARTALTKYELAEADMEIAADSLARSMHMLLEQHGLEKLEPQHMAALERDVLSWCGLLC